MEDLYNSLENLESEIKELKGKVKIGIEFTQEFLNKCGKAGYTRISIGKVSKKVPATVNFPFGSASSVFGFPSGTEDETGCPAIWKVVEDLKISGGAGNSDQHQVENDNLIEGIFELKKGKWRRIE